jgi:5'-3' exonuclease
MRKLAIDFASEMRKMQDFVDDVVVAVDSKSWRKDLYPHADYKGTRKQDDSVDWSGVYGVYEDFQRILQRRGVTIHQTQGAEADDVIFGWSVALMDRGKSCLVWSGDRDLIQLVNHSSANDAHTLWYYNSNKSLYAFKGFEGMMQNRAADEMSNDDILFNMGGDHLRRDQYQHNILEWIRKNGIQVTEVNCDEFVFKKMLLGDSSDNIPSVVTWQKEMSSGGLRNYSVTLKMAEKIWEQYIKEFEDFNIDYIFSEQQKTKICDIIYRVVGKSTPQIIKSRLNSNIALMLLHTRVIPESIQVAIHQQIDQVWEGACPDMSQLLDKDRILQDTEWLGAGSAPAGTDPFQGIEIPQEPAPIKKISGSVETNAQPKTKNLNNLF